MVTLTGLLIFTSFVHIILALPRAEDTAWKRTARAKKHPLQDLYQRTDKSAFSSSPTTACVDSNAVSITAPKRNVWGSLTDAETAAVTQWLFAQPDLNLTASNSAGDWDNTVSVEVCSDANLRQLK
jgi:primary-amine oxidase